MGIVEQVKRMKNISFKDKCSNKDIEEAENALGLKFSTEYKELLTQTGSFNNSYFDVSSINDEYDVVELTKEVRKIYSNIPKNLYVLIDVGVDGIYILQNEKGKIYEIDDSDEIIQSCNSFAEYLENFESRIG